MTIKRLLAVLAALGLALANLAFVSQTASAGLSQRECRNFDTSNNRRLSVCARIWYSDADRTITRGVVELHSYILVNGYPLADATSRSITLNQAEYGGGRVPYMKFGAYQGQGPNYCRVNGPSGALGCSVPNTSRVAFYSGQRDLYIDHGSICVDVVSFRDDQNNPWVFGSVTDGRFLFCYAWQN